MGSVLMLWGEPGDLVVDLLHLKQPAEEVGPLSVLHDHVHGHSTVREGVDLEGLFASTPIGLTVKDGARHLYRTDDPSPNEIEKVRRRLNGLVAKKHVERRNDPDGRPATTSARARDVRSVGNTRTLLRV